MDDTGLVDTPLHDDFNTGPGTEGTVVTISAAHTDIHIGGLTHSPRNQPKNLRSSEL